MYRQTELRQQYCALHYMQSNGKNGIGLGACKILSLLNGISPVFKLQRRIALVYLIYEKLY